MVAAAAFLAVACLACDSRVAEKSQGSEASNGSEAPSSPIQRPNFILVSIDTLRLDHLPIYG
jgi:hypothetical protein